MITISVKDAMMIILFAALLILVIYLIVVAANLIKTLKKANLVIDDIQRMSTIAADRTEKVNDQVDKFAYKFTNAVSRLKSDGDTAGRLYKRRSRKLNKKMNRKSVKTLNK